MILDYSVCVSIYTVRIHADVGPGAEKFERTLEHWNIGTFLLQFSDFGSKFQSIAKFYYSKPIFFKILPEIYVLSSKFLGTFLGTSLLLDFCSITRPCPRLLFHTSSLSMVGSTPWLVLPNYDNCLSTSLFFDF